jgi:hypothetical protein
MAAAVCPADYSWADNGQGMDPCAVASKLLAVCTPGTVLPDISGGGPYLSPTPEDQTDCSCSSPVYALVSACADCQDAFYVSWKIWSLACAKTYISSFPVSAPVNIPQWATFDVALQKSYSPGLAEAIAQNQSLGSPTLVSTPSVPTSTGTTTVSNSTDPASSSLPPDATSDAASDTASDVTSNTASNTASSPTPVQKTPTTATDTSPSSLNAAYSSDIAQGNTASRASQSTSLSGQTNSFESANKKSSNTGAIAGGTIGGLILLVILGGILFWWLVRRRRSRMAPSAAYIAAYGSLRPPTSLSARPLGERSNSAFDTRNSNPAYHDEEMRETTYPIDNKGPRYKHVPRESSPGVYGPS